MLAVEQSRQPELPFHRNSRFTDNVSTVGVNVEVPPLVSARTLVMVAPSASGPVDERTNGFQRG
ncbi:hypothetical protein BJF84_07555 [Rhodococcus sp. CUA-806]|nr:hypothetical protein BJF84_07555 [Rhodococcus sp. CUA-806]